MALFPNTRSPFVQVVFVLIAANVLLISAMVNAVTTDTTVLTGQQLFADRCLACHSIGQGQRIGPDLIGVTTRRSEAWLRRQLLEPDRLLAEGDPIASELVQRYGMAMPALGLDAQQVDQILIYLAHSERPTESTTPAAFWQTLALAALALVLLTAWGWRSGRKSI